MKDSDTDADADVHTEMKKKEFDEQHIQVKEPSHKLALAKEILTWTFKYIKCDRFHIRLCHGEGQGL